MALAWGHAREGAVHGSGGRSFGLSSKGRPESLDAFAQAGALEALAFGAVAAGQDRQGEPGLLDVLVVRPAVLLDAVAARGVNEVAGDQCLFRIHGGRVCVCVVRVGRMRGPRKGLGDDVAQLAQGCVFFGFVPVEADRLSFVSQLAKAGRRSKKAADGLKKFGGGGGHRGVCCCVGVVVSLTTS